INYVHFGEGRYDVTEHNIRTLLGITGEMERKVEAKVQTADQTQETYLGTARATREFTGDAQLLPLHQWTLAGQWDRQGQYAQAVETGATLTMHFKAKKVFLVLAGADNAVAGAAISLAGNTERLGADVKDGRVTVNGSRLYELVNLNKSAEDILTVRALTPGLQVYAFTFESDPE
ncbi:MAG: DipZ protein, partial [Micavibrio sp.]|nr:DipZ protein [Micavibrio sp.]